MDAKKLATIRCLRVGGLPADEIADLANLPVKEVESTIRSLKNYRPSLQAVCADINWLLRDHFELENEVTALENQVGRMETALKAITETKKAKTPKHASPQRRAAANA